MGGFVHLAGTWIFSQGAYGPRIVNRIDEASIPSGVIVGFDAFCLNGLCLVRVTDDYYYFFGKLGK